MSITLSSISLYALSSVVGSQGLSFVNPDRRVTHDSVSYLTSSLNITYPLFTQFIKSFNYENEYFTFITEYSNLSSYVNTLKGYGGQYYGSEMNEYNVTYDTTVNNFTISDSAISNGQYMGIVDRNFNFNILPLKNKISIDDSQYSLTDNYKNYQKTYEINDITFSQFKIDKIPVEIKPDQYTLLFNSYGVVSSHIGNYGLIDNGAIGGDCPLNSDIILFDQTEYMRYSDAGTVNRNVPNNGSLLCLWLSSQTPEPISEKIWMERWYDPNTITQNNAFINQKNTLSSTFSYVVDIPTAKIVSEKEKLTYLRYGPERNSTFINSFSSNLLFQFNQWGKNFQSTINEISGFVVGNYDKSTDTLLLDGTYHAHIPPEDIMLKQEDITISFWANASDWNSNNDAQLFGNYYNETGYGISYNNGTSNHLISIPTVSDNLYAINDRGFKVFEKDLKNDLGLDDMSITYIKTDLFGNRWLYDNFNKNIYKIENDDLVITTVSLPISSDIIKMECDSDNNLHILDTNTHQISAFNSSGNYLSTITLSSYHNNFDFLEDDTLIYDNAEFLTINSNGQIIKMVGPTLLIEGKRSLYLTDKPQSIRLDLDDNIWILSKNKLIKTDSVGNIIFKYHLETSFAVETAEMCFVKTNKNERDEINLWIVFNEQKYVIILNLEGKIVKRLDLSRLFIGNQCKDFRLNIKGDFTGFDNKRKFERVNDRAISLTNPAISMRIGLVCGINKKLITLHTTSKYLNEWNHISFSIKSKPNNTVIAFYINGTLIKTANVAGNYHINYGYKSSPFVVGGHSGKLGAKNLEKSIINKGFFKGEISDIRLYDRVLNDFEVLNLSLHKHYNKWAPITIYLKSPSITMLEEIDTFHINRYKGFKSNYFNINIKNFTDNAELKTLVSDYIKSNIAQFIPANTVLNTIKFDTIKIIDL
jgi:hypothetical protein